MLQEKGKGPKPLSRFIVGADLQLPLMPVMPSVSPTAMPMVPVVPAVIPAAMPMVPVVPAVTPAAMPMVPVMPAVTPAAVPAVPVMPPPAAVPAPTTVVRMVVTVAVSRLVPAVAPSVADVSGLLNVRYLRDLTRNGDRHCRRRCTGECNSTERGKANKCRNKFHDISPPNTLLEVGSPQRVRRITQV
jgi:hypothetical protein